METPEKIEIARGARVKAYSTAQHKINDDMKISGSVAVGFGEDGGVLVAFQNMRGAPDHVIESMIEALDRAKYLLRNIPETTAPIVTETGSGEIEH